MDVNDPKTINYFSEPVRLVKLKLALVALNMFDDINNFINTYATQSIKIWWEYGDNVDFLSERMIELKEALGITDEQYKQIYELCKTIEP